MFFFSCSVLVESWKPNCTGSLEELEDINKKTGDGVRSAFKNMYLTTCHSLESFLEFRTDDDEICICT